MQYLFAILFLPPVLVFAVYYFLLWIGWTRPWAFWRRVACASALTHVLLVAGICVFVWLDYRGGRLLPGGSQTLDAYLADSAGLAVVAWLGDPLPSAVLLGVLRGLEWARAPGTVVPLVAAVVFLSVGTFQWYWVGGGLAAAFERVWKALRRPGDDLPDWF